MSIMSWVDNKLSPSIMKVAENKYIQSVKDGMIAVTGLTIVGSIFLLIAYLPVPDDWYNSNAFLMWIQEHRAAILMPFRATMGVISVFAVFATASSMAKRSSLDPLSNSILSLVAFFMTLKWAPASETTASQLITVSKENADALKIILQLDYLPTIGDTFSIMNAVPKSLGLIMPLSHFGSKGLFVGFLCVFVVTAINKLFHDKKWTIQMPEGVPDGVRRSFEALIPLFITVTLFSLLHLIPSILPFVFPEGIIDLHTILQKLFFWLPWIINTLPGALIMVFIINLLWTVGIHGSAIVEGFTLPVLLQFLDANAHALLNGEPLPYILTNQFYYSFVWIGGGGATLGLAVLMAFASRSQALKAIGKSSLVPSIFNINEPVVFGTPVVLNPYLMVPYIIGPMICVIVSYFAVKVGWVNPTVAAAPWTFPSPLYAYVTTGGDWRAIILVFINLGITLGLYFPFFWLYDKQLYAQEKK